MMAALMSLFALEAIANETHEKMYLTQIIHQLEAMKPWVLSANHAQEKNARIQFHYLSYRDFKGLLHPGLLDDINAIQKGIEAKLNDEIPEPRHFPAIKGDYLETEQVVHSSGSAKEVNHVK
jgi:RAQPRD family integrative conjugative element protein